MIQSPLQKIMDWRQVLAWRNEMAETGNEVAVTNGCFDILHRGHAEYLYEARRKADKLLVLVNSDSSLKEVKGPTRPIIEEASRVYVLASLTAVDAVNIFSTLDCTEQLQQLKPDVYVKGGDYTEKTLVRAEYKLLRSMGTRIELIPPVEGLSTSAIIDRIRNIS